MLEITEEIKNFLDTAKGQKYFREITPDLKRSARCEFKKTLLYPPKTVRRRAEVLALLVSKINN